MPDGWVIDGLADAFEDEGGYKGGIKGPNAIYYGLCFVQRVQNHGVGS